MLAPPKLISRLQPKGFSNIEIDLVRLPALLAAVAATDKNAFHALYALTSKRLFPLAHSILNHRCWAEEALQEGFLIIWLKANRYDPGKGSAFSWMAKIVRNVCFDRLRADRLRRAVSVPLTSEAVDGSPSPFEVASRIADAIALRSGLAQLDPVPLAAVKSVFIDGLTHAELAAVSGIPIGTIKSRVRRGLIQLRTFIGESRA